MDESFVDLLERNADHARAFGDRFDEVQEAQHPVAVTVCCSDSRVLQDSIWNNDEPGRIFSSGNIGNRVVQRTTDGEVVSGDVLYPLLHTGTQLAVVVGHTGCGAVTATYDGLSGDASDAPGIEHSIDLLGSHLAAGIEALPDDLDRRDAVNRLVEYNVDRQVQFLRESDDVPDAVDVVGVVYDFQDVYSDRRGEVQVINVEGETDVEALREAHPEVADRIDRLWEY
ncbi:carbonic anhydrase [Halomicrobium salinisoli]|uniref:carbonic anhydrase n=1 Tax=Halomicrobium salinisoli TaxID=2878391 RepID=UPI001CF0AEB8|nr:carbonic anhydrase [Halomicrobium salinisoli]